MIEYIFTLDDGSVYDFIVNTKRGFDEARDSGEHPGWARLEFKQCTNCTLGFDACVHCPVALDIEDVLEKFKAIASHDEAEVLVKTPERYYLKKLDVRTALSSLLGLIMATSACPILSMLKSLAHYHLPFATLDETLFRTAGAYLLKQYFVAREGGSPDILLDGLSDFYQQLEELNACFSERLRAASSDKDDLGVVDRLFRLSMMVSFSLSDRLEALKDRFILSYDMGEDDIG